VLGAVAGVVVPVIAVMTIVAGESRERSPAMTMCRSALGSAVVAASGTTVGDVRGWDTGMAPPNDANRHPFLNAWPSAAGRDFAALCTTGSPDLYTFHAVGPDRTAVVLEQVAAIGGSPPGVPPPHG
jgi:hypothetical protein